MKIHRLRYIFCFIVLSIAATTSCFDKKASENLDISKIKSESFSSEISSGSNKKNNENNSSVQFNKVGFYANLPENFTKPDDFVEEKMLNDYGAIFLAKNGAVLPGKVIFNDEAEVTEWQNSVPASNEIIAGTPLELQVPAMKAFLDAREEAAENNIIITPRGTLGSKRSFEQTLKLWNSRFYPALNYWTQRGKISREEAAAAKEMTIKNQVERVLKWEEKGLFFSKDFQKSILNSAAVPGASQHIFLLALDIWQFGNPKAREIMAKHGWFQTVKDDFPHFTYLGIKQEDLPRYGLKAYSSNGYKFWLVNTDDK